MWVPANYDALKTKPIAWTDTANPQSSYFANGLKKLEVIMSISSMLEPTVRRVAAGTSKDTLQDSTVDPTVAQRTEQAIDRLTQYIPTEVVTFYVALVSALHTVKASLHVEWLGFYAMLAVTPVVVWLIYAAKSRANGLAWPLPPSSWPWWKFAAALIAFTAWAVALPQSPFESLSWYSTVFGPIIILGVTLILALLGAAFEPPVKGK